MTHNKDAYLAVIEFNKTIISVTSAILAALITFIVFQDYGLSARNIVAPAILILSAFFSILGFGHAIPAIRLDESRKMSVRFSNIGAILMVIGIFAIFIIKKPEKVTIDTALMHVKQSLSTTYPFIQPEYCQRIDLGNEQYIFHFQKDTFKRKVIYSIAKEQIVSTAPE